MSKNFITNNFTEIKKLLIKFPKTKICVVSKTQSAEKISEVISSGAKIIGENRVEEFSEKQNKIKFCSKVKKHFIGHLQSRKTKQAVEIFDLIESVDSEKLARKISQEAKKINKKIKIFLQVNIFSDPNKFGFSTEKIFHVCKNISQLENLEVCGLMTIGKLSTNEKETKIGFLNLKKLFEEIKKRKIFGKNFLEISMGMSNDFLIAAKCGSTIVRIGRRIFEETKS